MAKRNSSESTGGRRGSSSRPGKSSFSGKGKSSEKPYKKVDKSDSRQGPSARREKNSFSPKEERAYKRADQAAKPSFRKTEGEQRSRPFSSAPPRGDRPYKKSDKPYGSSPRKDGDSSDRRGRGFSKSDNKPSEKREPRSFGSRSDAEKPYKKFERPGEGEKRTPRSFGSPSKDAPSEKPYRKFDKTRDEGDKKTRGASASSEKPYRKLDKPATPGKDETQSGERRRGTSFGLPYKRAYDKPPAAGEERTPASFRSEKPYAKSYKSKKFADEAPHADSDIIRLNKYIANSGICSRREADEFIKMGLVSVNGTVVTELGHKVKRSDEVRYEDKVLKAEKPVYILMNKPKGYITTTKDPQERNTVMHIIAGQVKERVYPVGRLDRNTTGLLLLTNDGDLADKLMHPSYQAKKIYKVDLDRALTKADFQKIRDGVYLEEGRAVVDDIAIIGDDSKSIGLEIHIGWNRVVRRIFEALGYEVVKLDRSFYAGLDKKELPRGHWRALTKEEIVLLKHYKK
jgi:23S rRNA pseudouridine2605 synthase